MAKFFHMGMRSKSQAPIGMQAGRLDLGGFLDLRRSPDKRPADRHTAETDEEANRNNSAHRPLKCNRQTERDAHAAVNERPVPVGLFTVADGFANFGYSADDPGESQENCQPGKREIGHGNQQKAGQY